MREATSRSEAVAAGVSDLERLLAHPVIVRLQRALKAHAPQRADDGDGVRRAAVALILRAGALDALELLLIKRAMYPGDPWSGQVALPGGREEAGDATLADTAMRETWEETAVDLRQRGRLLGELDDLHPRTPLLPPIVISPFVFALGGDGDLVLSPEVADAFWVPLATLQDPRTSRETVIQLTTGPRAFPSFEHDGRTIWGLTERVLRQFLEMVRE
ncbi:MAG TPA: CoA pyrophosphatase [Gemmatimonadaceae bacterium]|nr:CoA pyrophosphatase [Gemmatimonadaceae bacterium]